MSILLVQAGRCLREQFKLVRLCLSSLPVPNPPERPHLVMREKMREGWEREGWERERLREWWWRERLIGSGERDWGRGLFGGYTTVNGMSNIVFYTSVVIQNNTIILSEIQLKKKIFHRAVPLHTTTTLMVFFFPFQFTVNNSKGRSNPLGLSIYL